MADYTSRLNLEKSSGTEVADIQVINSNFDKIDVAIGARAVTSATRPNSPFTGQLIYETDTGEVKIWDGSDWADVNVDPIVDWNDIQNKVITWASITGKPTVPKITHGTGNPSGGANGDYYFKII